MKRITFDFIRGIVHTEGSEPLAWTASQTMGVPVGPSDRLVSNERIREILAQNKAALDKLAELEDVCAIAYQVVGELASDAGRFEEERVSRALDNLGSTSLMHPMDTILPLSGGDS